MIELDLPPVTPIQVARQCYIKWQMGSFYADLENYLENGIVICRPDIFAMAAVQGEILFVRMAVGNLRTLLSYLPVRLPRIKFHRRNKGGPREYDMEHLLEVAGKIK